MPTPPANQTFSTFQLGTWNPATDTWTLLYDLNQPVTGPVWVMNKYPQWTAGEKYDSRSSTIRQVGERIVETSLKNGHWKVKISIRGTTYAAIAAIVRSISQAVEQPQLCIRYAAPDASFYLYFDVRKTTHNLHQAPAQAIIAGIQQGLIDFECYPLARGDRVWLQNLVANPGMDGPSGPAVGAFADPFTNVNAYTVVAGSAPAVAANVMTMAASSTLTFGSPAWGPVNLWQIRFKYTSGQTPNFFLHYVNANNALFVEMATNSVTIFQNVGGTAHSLASATPTLTSGNFYWLTMTQFPQVAGGHPTVSATLFNDSTGSIGTQVSTISGQTFDGVTALTGVMGLQCGTVGLQVGGPFVAQTTQYVALFGPGGWNYSSSGTGVGSGAWDGTRPEIGTSGNAIAGTNTTPNGPVTSMGAIRIDAAPAGTLNTAWTTWTGGSAPTANPAAAEAIPTVQGHVLGVACQMKSSGVASTCAQNLNIIEFSSTGTQLASGTVQGVSGAQAWRALSGTYTVTNASTAYVAVQLAASDSTSGSASGTIWWDNIQCWDQTVTGETSMPYCELRFAQSPAQLMVSGLLGDMPAPILLEFGTYKGAFNTTNMLLFAIGRKATTGLNAQLVSTPSAYSSSAAPTLASLSYGGLTVSQNGVTNSFITVSNGIACIMPDTQGIYHLISLMETAETAEYDVYCQFATGQFGATHYSQTLGALLTPFTAVSTFQPLDLGYIAIPSFPLMAAANQNAYEWYTQVNINDIAGTSAETSSWHLLLPYDAETLLGQIVNPSGYQNLTDQYIWAYNEALTLSQNTLVPQSWQLQGIGGGVANQSLAVPSNAAGGPGAAGGPFLYMNPTGSSFLREDPTQTTPNSGGLGVNQYAAYFTDGSGTVLPWFCDILYSPYYYYQR